MSWEEKRIGEVCILNYGKNLPKTKRQFGEYPVYSSAGLIDYHSKSLVDEEGIIIGRKGSVGTLYYSKKPFFPIDTSYYV
ncbi:restriction endonuclease subunit S [Leeuwenhoekiella parthenopeia]|uniref:Restriction endonuclease subunit S n=1 Tax=Leeuwenhoekiella parthenopeia TaxID=2890320 RepID=A0ABS8GMY7_9FLAO|nr:restriction endonuclease subunit S [Leeuwenhoekiella parthenopeia]MCC4211335.1 restriction endonuclease subunit S [Leeuwenhoekiella parthenopeia]